MTHNSSSSVEQPGFWRTTVLYGLMVLATIVCFWLVRGYGESLTAPAPVETRVRDVPASPHMDTLRHVLIALAAVIFVGQILAKLFAYLGQPPVIGEVVAGIVLGPSLLGADISAHFLEPSAAPVLSMIAQLGVILYMFLVGLELNAELLKHRARVAVAISHASIQLPFLLGAVLAIWLYPRLSNSSVSFTSFALFMGVAMSITAFPVLARILTDRRLTRTELGVVALSCAATDDVTAWCLLAFVVGVAKSQVEQSLLVAGGALAYVAFMLLIARPIVNRFIARTEADGLSRNTVALVFVALLLSALATESIGIHAIFGAFLLGAVIPHESAVAREMTAQLEHIVTVLLLPAYFALTGMRTRIDLVQGLDQWLMCGVIILVATVGKFGGTIAAARWTGLSWRNANALGVLMNTRGLMELIVLNIGLDLHVISPSLFAMMVLMALATTMATAPLLRILVPESGKQESARHDEIPQQPTLESGHARDDERGMPGHQRAE